MKSHNHFRYKSQTDNSTAFSLANTSITKQSKNYYKNGPIKDYSRNNYSLTKAIYSGDHTKSKLQPETA